MAVYFSRSIFEPLQERWHLVRVEQYLGGAARRQKTHLGPVHNEVL